MPINGYLWECLDSRFLEGSEHRIDAGLVASSSRLKPFQHVCVDS